MHVDQTGDHLALAITHGGHVDAGVLLADPKFLAAEKVGRDLGAVDNVLARQARDVRTGTSDPFPLDDHGPEAFFGQGPGEILTAFAAAEDDEIEFFR